MHGWVPESCEPGHLARKVRPCCSEPLTCCLSTAVVSGTLGSMADFHYRTLRRRRRMYEIRAGSGFEGYVVGSWQHAFQLLIRPFGISVALFGALVVRGAGPVSAAGLSGVLMLGLWLVAGIFSFVRGMRRVHAGPPPPPRSAGWSGVREPRRPPPDPGILAAEVDPPSRTST